MKTTLPIHSMISFPIFSALFLTPNTTAHSTESLCNRWNNQFFFQTVTLGTIKGCIRDKSWIIARGRKKETPLHTASRYTKDASVIRTLVDAGADTEARDHNEETPIFWNIQWNNNPSVLSALLNSGANINAQDKDGELPLHFALRNGKTLNFINLILNRNPNLEIKGKYNSSTLHHASANINPDVYFAILKLLGSKADFNKKDGDGEIPLHWAARWNSNETVFLDVLKKTKNIFSREERGNMPLHFSVYSNTNWKISSKLLKTMKSMNDVERASIEVRNYAAETPLHRAVLGPSRKAQNLIISNLLRAGAQINAKTDRGRTPLHLAVTNKLNLDLIALLHTKGAKINIKDESGITPLHLAAGRKASLPTLLLLLRSGADPNAQNEDGETPLHFAARWSRKTDALKILIDNGSRVDILNDAGQSPLHWAVRWGRGLGNVEIFLNDSGSAMVNGKDEVGDTPLHWAIRWNKKLKLVKLLIDSGANPDIKNERSEDALILAKKHKLFQVVKYLNALRNNDSAPK